MSSMIVPVIDVQNDNFKELWPALVLAIKTSSFIALDTELSGLGSRKDLLAQCIEERYKAICSTARTRSILSLGIACFKKLPDKAPHTYLVQVYNLTLLCMQEYVIEPQSVQFLVQHGFDFNKQYAQGIPYHKGNDKGGDLQSQSMRALFLEVIQARKPLVLHNGLIDLVFLYQCFYAWLPDRLGTFTADLSEIFPAGIFDTKHAAEFEVRFMASYLEYAYKKCKRENFKSVEAGGPGPHLSLEFCNYAERLCTYIDFRQCTEGGGERETGEEGPPAICMRFSAYGWCPNGSQCTLSHNTDLIIEQDEQSKDHKRRRKNKRKFKAAQEESRAPNEPDRVEHESSPPNKHLCVEDDKMQKDRGSVKETASADVVDSMKDALLAEEVERKDMSDEQVVEEAQRSNGTENKCEPQVILGNGTGDQNDVVIPQGEKEGSKGKEKQKMAEGGTHRAGFDAFMTGYIFAYVTTLKAGAETDPSSGACLPDCLNKVYLSGKSVPLQIVKSSFSKSSKAHTLKMESVWGKI
ncbi:target of EGR1 protein 1-like [Acipenser ruthenus]|uniref:target of EGR1 protein 1-like n=1 Tax=Acipenser ruthenus TaxID=7906 RepID=UPI002740800D|nr:target of EGR1 protein 1-like [Acipenser ruthenus]XP_033869282.3 target of EGR1 protein 1-like [Acipenser ruthenus]XP_058887616.1 target of EGR1 protein 1-like [Acipenser ruthenus]